MVSTANPSRHCAEKSKGGAPCQGYAMVGSDYCYHHDPERAAQRAESRRRGGQARHGRVIGEVGPSEPVVIATVADVVSLLQRAINDALSLENSLNRARTLGSLAGFCLKALEVGEIEQRLSILEQKIGELSRDKS